MSANGVDRGSNGGVPRAMTWSGWALSGLFVVFMLFDITIKLIQLPIVAQTMVAMGWPGSLGLPIGVIELVALVLYVYPRTAVLGAILMTGVMGGAIASHWRIGDPLVSHVLFGVYLGLFAWGGLWLRDPRLRAVTPWRT
jgi:hypothetical protein